MTPREKSALATERALTAPKLPSDRPPTRREVWERFSVIYDGLKTKDELARYCREAWVWYYVQRYNFQGWRKHPDWTDGPVIQKAVPSEPFFADEGFAEWDKRVYECLQIANQLLSTTERKAA